jgi:hypothetical protein
MLIPAAWGIILAVTVAVVARLVGFDRDRALYPIALLVIASYYDLFAVLGGTRSALIEETIAFALFASAAVIGFRTSLWIVAAALAAHGVFDFFHHGIISNGGVPAWWPAFCLSYDVAAAGCLAILLRTRHAPRAG